MTPKWLHRATIEILHDESLANHGGLSGIRDSGLLESALERPKNRHHYGDGDIHNLAGEYAFGVARNHPFLDGNKRTAFLAAATFLAVNGYTLTASEADATLKTLALAAGELDADAYARWLRENTGPA